MERCFSRNSSAAISGQRVIPVPTSRAGSHLIAVGDRPDLRRLHAWTGVQQKMFPESAIFFAGAALNAVPARFTSFPWIGTIVAARRFTIPSVIVPRSAPCWRMHSRQPEDVSRPLRANRAVCMGIDCPHAIRGIRVRRRKPRLFGLLRDACPGICCRPPQSPSLDRPGERPRIA